MEKRFRILIGLIVGITIILLILFSSGREFNYSVDELSMQKPSVGRALVGDLSLSQAKVKSVPGLVKSVGADSFLIELSAAALDGASEGVVLRTIRVDRRTKFVERTYKSTDDLAKEMEEYSKASEEVLDLGSDLNKLPTPPKPYEELLFNLSSVQIGERLHVSSDEDFVSNKQVLATEVVRN